MSIFDFTNQFQNYFVICRILVHNQSSPLPPPCKTEKKKNISLCKVHLQQDIVIKMWLQHLHRITQTLSYYSHVAVSNCSGGLWLWESNFKHLATMQLTDENWFHE